MRKNQPRSLDQTGSKVVEFIDSMRDLMEKEEDQEEEEERLDRMETYICSQLYDR
jgi:hypothetical protein